MSMNNALKFLGECLKTAAWWAVLIAIVGAIVLTAFFVGKVIATVATGVALGGSAVAVVALAPEVALVAGGTGFLYALGYLFGGGESRRSRRTRGRKR
jgi:hypothetical protein